MKLLRQGHRPPLHPGGGRDHPRHAGRGPTAARRELRPRRRHRAERPALPLRRARPLHALLDAGRPAGAEPAGARDAERPDPRRPLPTGGARALLHDRSARGRRALARRVPVRAGLLHRLDPAGVRAPCRRLLLRRVRPPAAAAARPQLRTGANRRPDQGLGAQPEGQPHHHADREHRHLLELRRGLPLERRAQRAAREGHGLLTAHEVDRLRGRQPHAPLRSPRPRRGPLAPRPGQRARVFGRRGPAGDGRRGQLRAGRRDAAVRCGLRQPLPAHGLALRHLRSRLRRPPLPQRRRHPPRPDAAHERRAHRPSSGKASRPRSASTSWTTARRSRTAASRRAATRCST